MCVSVYIHTHTSENGMFPAKSVQQRQQVYLAGCRAFFNWLVACLSWMFCRFLVVALHPLSLPWLRPCFQIQRRDYAVAMFAIVDKAVPCYRCQESHLSQHFRTVAMYFASCKTVSSPFKAKLYPYVPSGLTLKL